MRNKVLTWFVLFTILTVTFCLIPSTALAFYYDNPAEEAFTTTRFELLIPQFNLGAKNNLFNLNNLNIDLTDPDVKDKFLNQMGGGIFRADLTSQLKMGLTIGRFSLHLRPWAAGSFRLSPAIPELIFVGYGPDKNGADRVYNLAGSKINGLTAVSLDVQYGHPIRLDRDSELGVGINLRYIKGLAMCNSELTSGTLKVNKMGEAQLHTEGRYLYADFSEESEGNFSLSNLPGTGFLADLGVSYAKDRIRAGLVLKNIGAITWKNVTEGTVSYDGEVTLGREGLELTDAEPVEEEETGTSYTTNIPLVLQVQGSYRFLDPLYCYLGMETGFSDGWGISNSPRLWTGLEWKPRHLIRMAGGVSYHERHFNYNALLELRLFCLWANLELDWMHDFGGLNASAMLALHF